MSMYGINNVRGGSYVSIKLPDYQIKALQTELSTSGNKCFNCQGTGHYVESCPEVITKSNYVKGTNKIPINIANKGNKCYRCGRFGHWANNCYANKDANGNYLGDSEDSYESEDYYYD